eukprot:9530061-Heterocapsa_arctica.AAC.1
MLDWSCFRNASWQHFGDVADRHARAASAGMTNRCAADAAAAAASSSAAAAARLPLLLLPLLLLLLLLGAVGVPA